MLTHASRRYRKLEKLGEGGFGAVWKAEAVVPPAGFVALKIPTCTEGVDRLRHEASVMRGLCHAHIVKVLDWDEREDPPCLVLEYVDGLNLRQAMQRDGILPPRRAIRIVTQLCAALAFAHDRRILHHDLKPENVLLESGPGRRAKLADFGLGVRVDGASSRIAVSGPQRSAGAAGTPYYMAPEQRTPGRPLDARADVYSLGVVLYEALTGELPVGMSLPSELNPVVSRFLDEICKRSLALDRDRRYPSVRALAADLLLARRSYLVNAQ